MIIVFTKQRHISKISKFLDSNNLDYKCFTINTLPEEYDDFDLGVSYSFPRMIEEPLLSRAKLGFINYHSGPLPNYKGPYQGKMAIKNKEMNWGVSVHYMDKDYDTGPLIKVNKIQLHEPPICTKELGAISHYFLFKLFKETLIDLYNK